MKENFISKANNKLIIRLIQPDDYDMFHTYLERIATESNFTNQYKGKPRPTIKEFEQSIKSNWTLLVLNETETKIVASTSATRLNHPWMHKVCYVSIYSLKDFHYQGIGTFLMKRLHQWAKRNDIHRLEAEICAANTNALSLFLKQDFIIEGCKQSFYYVNEKWHDEYIVGKIMN